MTNMLTPIRDPVHTYYCFQSGLALSPQGRAKGAGKGGGGGLNLLRLQRMPRPETGAAPPRAVVARMLTSAAPIG